MKVMLVEDTRSIAMVMAARLQSIGHQVSHVVNGQEAVDLFGQLSPDLVIMDIDMPVMNGFKATARIRELEKKQRQWTPIIFLTASDTLENLLTAIEAGGDDFLPKSAPEEVLLAKMTAMARVTALRSELTTANRKLEWMAAHDPLTGLSNRRHTNTLFDLLWARSKEKGRAVGLLMIDVDNFKKYNDHYGHQTGDQCLIDIARAIESGIQPFNKEPETALPCCFAGRYGGEEFCVGIAAATPEHVAAVAESIRDALAAKAIPHVANGDYGRVTLSIGASVVKPGEKSIANTFQIADQALYQSKANGRNRVTFG